MNMPRLLDALDEVGVENPIVCSNINKIGFRMSGGIDAYRRALEERRVPGDRDVGVRVRRHPAAGGLRMGLRSPKIESVVFGASSLAHIRSTKEIAESVWAAAAPQPVLPFVGSDHEELATRAG